MSQNIVDFIKNQYQTTVENPLLPLFSKEARGQVLALHQKLRPSYGEAPLVRLDALAAAYGLGELYVKDESRRGSLNAFKLLGGSYAVINILCRMAGMDVAGFELEALKKALKDKKIENVTFAAASDGNHGRSVAFAAYITGQTAVIYMPKGTAEDRIKNIEALGSKVVVTDGNYDDCGRMITEDSEKYGWSMVPDTASEGDPQIARWVMQGYLTMASEIMETLDAPPTHLFLQAGVGSMAAAMMTAFKQEYQQNAPAVYIMEPHQADCFYRSGQAGKSVSVTGDLDSMMAGLSCGVPSPDAWSLIKDYADGFFSVDDRISANGMRILASPLEKDEKIVSGESGAVGTGLIDYIMTKSPELKSTLGLNDKSRVLLISTEGATDRKNYRDVVWYGKNSGDFNTITGE